MDFDNNRPVSQRHDISEMGIKCAECDTLIKELPFLPTKRQDDTYGKLYCFECNKKRKPSFRGPREGGGFGR